VTLCLVPETLDTVDMVVGICKKYRVVNSEIPEVRNIQHIFGLPAVRIDDAVRHDFALNDRGNVDLEASGMILV
jgi:hypothetical protein